MIPGNGHVSVPPGFRFHPTDEELLCYYLTKKVAYEVIDLDVITDIDLNKLEPWDLKDKCRIGSGPQTEWYFFSHKDKKYPTGTRTNRATTAGFWKATGRDKAIHLSNSKRIGMRKTLVFYTGRAPHGQKTDWIMHEYRLDDEEDQNYSSHVQQQQEDGWVVCRVFKKKNLQKDFQVDGHVGDHVQQVHSKNHMNARGSSSFLQSKQHFQQQHYGFSFDGFMHLPQLLSTDSTVAPPPTSNLSPFPPLNTVDIQCTHNLMKLTSRSSNGGDSNTLTGGGLTQQERTFNGDWSFLDKLLASQQSLEHLCTQTKCNPSPSHSQVVEAAGPSIQKFPFNYLGCEADILKFSM